MAVLNALLRHVETIELDGPPQRKLNSVLRGWGSMPVRWRAAGTAPALSRRLAGGGSECPMAHAGTAAAQTEAMARHLRSWRRIVRTKLPLQEQAFWENLPSTPLAGASGPLDVRTLGAGPTVLWVPGVGGRGSQFRPITEMLADHGYRSVMPDLGGGSDRRVHYGGVDMIARQILALSRREREIHGLVTHSMGNPWSFYAMAAGLRPQAFVALSGIFEARFVYDRFQRSRNMSDEDMVEFEKALAREERGQNRAWQDPSHVVKEIALPARALLLHAGADEIVPARQGRAFAEAWPAARYAEIADATHEGIIQAAETIRLIGDLFPERRTLAGPVREVHLS